MTHRAVAGTPTADSTIAALRSATAPLHERLHRLELFRLLAEGSIDRARYGALLSRLLGFHAPVEAAMAGFLDVDRGLAGRRWRRAHLLRDDLASLGLDASAANAPPTVGPLLSISCLGEALGCLYVLHGSTLGGRLLASGLDARPGYPGTAGRSFLLAGTDPGHLGWREFCGYLERRSAGCGPRSEVLAGAVATFRAFERWFEAAL